MRSINRGIVPRKKGGGQSAKPAARRTLRGEG
jgi:hypothetical protein